MVLYQAPIYFWLCSQFCHMGKWGSLDVLFVLLVGMLTVDIAV